MGEGGMRAAWTPDMALWDAGTACVAVTYLAMRRRFGQLLRTPEMFRDDVERTASRELSEVLDQLPEGVIVLNEAGEAEQLNAAGRGLGLDPDRLGTSLGEQVPQLQRTRDTGEAVDGIELSLPGGPHAEGRMMRVSARALRSEEEPPHRVVVSLVDVTQEHKARAELHDSERHHRTVVNALHEGVVMQQHDGQITACNPEAERLLGLTREQMMGRTSLDPRWRAVHGDGTDWPGEEHPVPRTLATGEPVGPETMGIHAPDGAVRWLDVSAMPVVEEGLTVGAVASFVDITARVEAELALQASADQMEATLEGLSEGVVFYDEHLAIRNTNRAAARMLGLPADETARRGMAWTGLTVLDADRRPLPRAQLPNVRAAMGGTSVARHVLGLLDPDGGPDADVRWVEVNAVPLTGQRPERPWPVVMSVVDITERLTKERALVEAEQRFRSMFYSAPVGMRVAELDGTILEANQALADLLGLEVSQLVGSNWAEVTNPEDADAQRTGEGRLLAGEIAGLRLEKRYLHAAGHAIWAQLDLTLLRDADGNPVGTIGQIQDISDRRVHEEQLRHLADHDALTGLLNRRGFLDELERHVGQVERYGESGALLMLDIDHFKYVNDTLGHKAGDEVIIAVADVLRARLRKTDVIARLGGDEFAVLLPRGTTAEARQAAEQVLSTLRDQQDKVLPILGRRLKLTASIGVSGIDGTVLTADELLVNADLAMYDAKEAGRDQVAGYEETAYAEPRVRSRTTWMERIGAALEHDRFTMLAQPICDLQRGGVEMHELLLRMVAPDGDLISPASFLYVAERFDLVQDIDRWVVDHACGLLGRMAPGGPSLSLNISARSMEDPARLVAHVAAALETSGADPSRLVLEITETAAVSQIHHARTFAREVQALGCRLAIDDFGAGFGSFYYLKHLPFDFLKIDGEFVTHARSSRPDALIVTALRDMAHGLGRRVVAEYCADQETEDYLRAEGIDLGQGFHLGRPVPAATALGVVEHA